MPHYYFIIKANNSVSNDREGTELSDEAAAITHACRVIRDLKEGGAFDDPAATLIITDRYGREFTQILFSDVPLQPD